VTARLVPREGIELVQLAVHRSQTIIESAHANLECREMWIEPFQAEHSSAGGTKHRTE
jgi:hypothetical protein